MNSVTSKLITVESMRTRRRTAQDALLMAAALRDRGLRPADRVMLKADNSIDYVTAVLALIHLDASIVLLDHRQTAEETGRVAAMTGTRFTIVQRGAPVEDGQATVALEDLTSGVSARTTAGTLSFDDWRRRTDALIAWSSGSTGDPKGIVRSGDTVLANLESSQERMRYRSEDVLVPLVPYSHQYGLSIVLLWWLVGCSLAVAPYGRLDQALRLAGECGATVVDALPSTYHTFLNLIGRRPKLLAELAKVRMWCVGGAPLNPSLAHRFAKEVGLPLLDGYGSTEAGNIALATPDNPVGCGRPLRGVDVRILDDDDKELPAGRTGEVWVRSAALMQGYLTEDGRVVSPPENGYRTNDLGYVDADGNLYVIGRKYAVHRLGYTIYPEALERKAEACGRPVKVVPVDDERRGCRLVFIVMDPAGKGPAAWRREYGRVLPAYERPNHVVVMDGFPVNRTGKPDTARLRQIAADACRSSPPPAAVFAKDRFGPLESRIAAIKRVAELIALDSRRLVDILTEISPYKAAISEIEAARRTLEGAADEVMTYQPGRISKVAAFMPSNILLYSYVLYLLVPSLFAEQVSFRPARAVQAQAERLHELLAPVHGLPIRLSAASQREFVDDAAKAADVIVFTGAYANAEQVRGRLADHQLLLFFGQGINPFVVAPGAGLERAVNDAVRIRLHNSGQDCFGPDAFFVHESEFDPFLAAVEERLSRLRYGEYTDPEADYGPLFYDGALETAAEYLRRNHEHIRYGGSIDFRSRRLEPTVLARRFSDRFPIVELFSPIFNVVGYDDPHALRSRLLSPFFSERALGAMVYGGDTTLIAQLRKQHIVAANATLLDIEDGNRPFGGRGVMANYLSHFGRRVGEPLLVSKAVAEYPPASR